MLFKKNIIYWLKYLTFKFPIEFIFIQFESMMLEQLSFDNEIRNHKKFKENQDHNVD